MDAFEVLMPSLLFNVLVALPLVLGIIAAVRHWWADRRTQYLQNLCASIAAGAVLLGLLWSSLFGDSLSGSSTAGLIFGIAPLYAAAAQLAVYFLAGALLRNSPVRHPIATAAWAAILVPAAMMIILATGMVKLAAAAYDSGVAQRASNPAAMRQLMEKVRAGQADAFAIPLHLAQNADVPADLLAELARHEHPAVRAQVARNGKTPNSVVESLRHDCASFVRKIVVERLGPGDASAPAPAATGTCALERWR